jgi:hypothetical protein
VEVSYGARNSSCADACDRVRIGRTEEQAERLSSSSITPDVEGGGDGSCNAGRAFLNCSLSALENDGHEPKAQLDTNAGQQHARQVDAHDAMIHFK